MADIYSSRPYNILKDIKPTKHFCEDCDRSMRYLDKGAHERSKKHAEQVKKNANDENVSPAATFDTSSNDHNACHNCGKKGHKSKECPEPRSFKNVECRRCSEKGHMASDCPKGSGRACHNCGKEGHNKSDCTEERVPFCRNCEQKGHSARECPLPKDWGKVQCRNCQEFGHGEKRCPKPPAEPAAGEDWGEDGATAAPAATGDWANEAGGAAAPSTADWESSSAAPVANGQANGGWETAVSQPATTSANEPGW